MSLLQKSLFENRRTLALAAPIIAGHLGQMSMGWADAAMVGRIGVVPLAACAFANTVLAIPLVFGFGILSSVSVRASHAHGSGDRERCGETLRSGTILAAALGILIAAFITLAVPLVPLLGQKPEVNAASINFLVICAWSIVPIFIGTVAKNFCEALGRPWIPFWLMIGSVLINVGLNWVLIYGNLGAPKLGIEGAGIATLIARLILAAALFVYLFTSTRLRSSLPLRWLRWPVPMGSLLKIGLPAGGMHLCEVSGFAIGSLMMGWISVGALAAHQIAMTCAATAFMIPLGLGQAVSVRVGQSRGSLEIERLKPIVSGALGLATILMIATALVFLIAGRQIASVFVPDVAVVALAAHLLTIAGIFQIFDGIQVVCAGALRGFEDTRVPMFIGVLAYWLVALPVSYLSAFTFRLGATGVWIGFVVGLMVAALLLARRLFFRVRKTIAA